ncbi:MAG TPA: hypothetical protein VMU38_05420 [Candidatus Binatia bacterium]|nr:hypothetical protein [Candidatus Binatia bacterium]
MALIIERRASASYPPFGSSDRRMARRSGPRYPKVVLIEIAVVALTIVSFVLLELYVAGCERV